MNIERRSVRSPHRSQAMSLALAAAAQASGASAAVLADDDGLLVAGAGEGLEHERLAAFAAGIGAAERARLLVATAGQPLQAAAIRVHGKRMFFATVGGSPGEAGHAGQIDRVERAATRILAL